MTSICRHNAEIKKPLSKNVPIVTNIALFGFTCLLTPVPSETSILS